MGSTGEKKLGVIGPIAVVAVLVAFVEIRAAEAESPVRIPAIPALMEPGFTFEPRALPKDEPTAVRLQLSATLRNPQPRERAYPPAAEELVVELDRNIEVDPDLIPACGHPGVRSHIRKPFKICPTSVIAKGTATFEVPFDDAPPIYAEGVLTLFRAARGDRSPQTFLHVPVAVPTPQDLIGEVKLSKPPGSSRYGTRVTVAIPKVAGGVGFLKRFTLTIPRRVRREGELLSVATMRCSDGKAAVRADATFADGSESRVTAVRPCTPRLPAR